MAEIQYTSLLRSTAADNKLAKTDQIFDDTRSKFQKDINAELLSLASKTEAYVLPGDLGTLGNTSNASAINGVLGTYSAFKAAYDAKKLIVGRWGEYLFAPSVYVDGGTVLLRALSGLGTYRAVSLTFNGSAWTAVKSVSKDSPLVNVVNELTNSSTASALSAAMGKKLQDEKLAKTDVVNNLTTTDTSKALSAAQGKALNDRINGLGSVYRIKGTKANISEVLALTDAKVGDAWNVTAEFTLGGKKYPAGTNVVCVTNTSSSDHNDDNWDALGGTVDLSPYAKQADMEMEVDAVYEELSSVVRKSEIVNNLTSSNVDKPLSAAQGKKLQDEKLSKTDASGTYATKASVTDAAPYVLPGDITGVVMGTATTGADIKKVFGTPKAVRDAWTAGKVFIGNRGGNAGASTTKGGLPLTLQIDDISKQMYVVVTDTLLSQVRSFSVKWTDDSTWQDATNVKSSPLHPETGITIQ